MTKTSYTELNSTLEEYFSSLKKLVPASPNNLYEPVRYFLDMTGKRLRPLLVLIAADCFNGQTKKALPAAAAVELFHNFSLIHDDIMDNAPLRRGKSTIHEKWNNNIAILSGDVLLVKAYQQLAKCENITALEKTFSQTAIEVCEGQQYDMDFESRADVRMDEYLEMISLKTAVLIACSLKMGALCAGAEHQAAQVFYTAGKNLGLAFQLTDDHLDVYGNSEKTGKMQGGDIIADKKTWLLIKAYELANQSQKNELNKWIGNKQPDKVEKIRSVKKIFDKLNLSGLLEKEIEHYYNKTVADLHAACPNAQKVEVFITFIRSLMHREK